MVKEIIDADEVNNALRIIRSIKEEPTPAYLANQKKRKCWSPQVCESMQPAQPSLSEQEKPEYQRYEMDSLLKIRDICDWCPDCSDCWYAKEMRALDMCVRVKRNMELKK
jgi:hypothetical protein